MTKRSTINGFEFPHVWTPRPRKPEPERVHVLFARGGAQNGLDDRTCGRCGLHVCNCPGARAGEPERHPNYLLDAENGGNGFTYGAPAQEAAELPEGWEPSTKDGLEDYFHPATNALVRNADLGDGWRAFPANGGSGVISCTPERYATRAEAMAAALGFAILGGGYSYLRHDAAGRVQALQTTAEAAALAALRFDAEQRRRDSTSGTNPVSRGGQG